MLPAIVRSVFRELEGEKLLEQGVVSTAAFGVPDSYEDLGEFSVDWLSLHRARNEFQIAGLRAKHLN